MTKHAADARILSSHPRRTRSMSSSSSDDKLLPRAQQIRRVGDACFSVSPSLLSERSDSPVGYTSHRRRVNPASLASRLGPDLVQELEGLLAPGMTEMPSFAARQAIQKKYNIDRRHIYDWYHTKGLRVTTKEKEDQRAKGIDREAKVLRSRIAQRTIRQRPSQIDIPVPSPLIDANHDSSSSSPSTSAMPITPSATFNIPFYESGIQPTTFPIHHFFDEPLGGVSADKVANATQYTEPATQNPAVTATGEWTRCIQAERTSHWINETHGARCRVNTNACLASAAEDYPGPDTAFPISYEQPLPQDQREAYYQYLADALGPAHGVQESIGSYKAYMTRQVQTYHERLLPSGPDPSFYTTKTSPAPPVSVAMPNNSFIRHDIGAQPHGTVYAQTKHQLQDTEYSKWLLYGRRSLASSITPTPVCTPSVSGFAGTPQTDENLSWLWNAPQIVCADSLESSLDISDLLESPVLRSRHPTAAGSTPIDMSVTTLDDLLQRAAVDISSAPATVDEDRPGTFQHPALPDSAEYPHSLNSISASASAQIENHNMSIDLRTAKEPQGLEKTVAATPTKGRDRTRVRTRSRRYVTISTGGDI